MDKVDCVVIGAGVVGLAIARQLAILGRDVIILEAEDNYGSGISSRNSEVIHAGIYYPQGSLKARLCVQGRQLLYRYCEEKGVSHSRCGKLIVATDTYQLPILEKIRQQAFDNGVTDIRRIDRNEAYALEPSLHCVGALHSPATGIIDSHGLMTSLLGDAEALGATLVRRSPVIAGRVLDEGIKINVGGINPVTVLAKTVINSAGLGAQAVAKSIEVNAYQTIPPLSFAKGNYFSLSGKPPFTHLIYPVPEVAGLGVHLTLDLGGQAKFGPDVEWIPAPEYEINTSRVHSFYEEIRRYWPELPNDVLMPAYAGIRPKPHLIGEGPKDFIISSPKEQGTEGLVNLYGIESPGLTSCLAIAKYVANLLDY